MSNHENQKLGRCCYLEAGERCGCQRYRVDTRHEHICDVCSHDSGFHEKKKEETTIPVVPAFTSAISTRPAVISAPSTSDSLLNQVLSGQALEEQSIANELRQTFTRRNLTNRTQRGSFKNFDPATTITQSNRNRRREDVVKEFLIQVILLPDFGFEIQSPTTLQDK